ncbi:conserved hypothetical protein [Cryptococcus deneoformans JEC21]|uniref:Protein arginine methyltransferase NDUFAF7 n=1 Tax=Cryptococcus deneoformans (strain JEC21 / ATCC MYA-565) TaxID=214684 RepID=Q5KK34_CRYD1|nr:conserved hypothetical protein [Cryptococcus neoformans var. neoformans JEC21]AAW42702.1 conserved hypothetical protein [Cryptococcus neoformans var. neoformans JEC21]
MATRGSMLIKRISGAALRRKHTPLPAIRLPSLPAVPAVFVGSRRGKSTSTTKGKGKERYNFNTSIEFSNEPDPDHVNWRKVTAADLAARKEPPTRVKMLVRDFIDDSLYNPNYGYFSHHATIFTPPKDGFDIISFRDVAHFQETVAERYEREYGLEPTEGAQGGLGRQVWHTPTELFKPYYARSLISAIVQSYKLYHFPSEPLIIYEIGAGNGSFMIDSLTYLRDHHPDVFARTKYRIIEISSALAKGQRERAEKEGFGMKVQVLNKDFFQWDGVGGGDQPCFVVALEVFDNFAHDMVRYELDTLTPRQAVVGIDASGDFTLLYETINDPLISRVLSYNRLLPQSSSTLPPLPYPLLYSETLRKAYASMPFAPNLSAPDFLPTKAVLFAEKLREKLPGHRLLMADFDELPDAVGGRNGPVVQTRYGNSMIPCETFLVKQGYFDIFFPTNFEHFRDLYSIIMNSPSRITPSPSSTPDSPSSLPSKIKQDFFSHSSGVKGFRRRNIGIYTHADFLAKYGGKEILDKTTVKDGANVMTAMYKNAKMMF